MAKLIFKNNAQSILAGSISGTATSIQLAAGTGVLFAAPQAGEYFVGTIIDAATGLLNEIVWVTSVLGDTLTVVRAQEDTTAKPWAANDAFAELWTAGQAQQMLQQGENQAQASNYGLDTGSVNAVRVALDPNVTAPVAGMPIRVLIANTNTGDSTLDPGHGPSQIVNGQGAALGPGALTAGIVNEFIWNGTKYNHIGPAGAGAGGVAAGIVAFTAAGTPPAGWLFCYAQSLLRSQYPDLFAAISTTFGAVDATHFTLPDARGRVIAGLDGGTGRLTGTIAPNGNTLGGAGGAQYVAYGMNGATSGSLPVSYNGVTNGDNDGLVWVSGSTIQAAVHVHTHNFSFTAYTSGQFPVSGNTDTQTNVQPTLMLHAIIKATNT